MNLFQKLIEFIFPLPQNPAVEWEEKRREIENQRKLRRRALVSKFSRGSVSFGRGKYTTQEQRDSRLHSILNG